MADRKTSEAANRSFDMLKRLGLTPDEVKPAADHINLMAKMLLKSMASDGIHPRKATKIVAAAMYAEVEVWMQTIETEE